MMLRIARKNQVDMTTEPSGVLTGEDEFKREREDERSHNHWATNSILSVGFLQFSSLCNIFKLSAVCYITAAARCDEMSKQRIQRH